MTTINAVGNGLSGATGTGNFVGANTPTLITPVLGVASATSIQLSNTGIIDTNTKVALALSATASAVNGFTLTNAATNNSPNLAATGTDSNIIATIKGKGTGGVALLGTSTNDSASAGYFGEVISSSIVLGSAVAITTTATPQNLTSISLTAGDWDVWANVGFTGNNSTVFTTAIGGISSTSITLPDASLYSKTSVYTATTFGTLGALAMPVVQQRLSLASTTTIYLVVEAFFTTSTCSSFGVLFARRAR